MRPAVSSEKPSLTRPRTWSAWLATRRAEIADPAIDGAFDYAIKQWLQRTALSVTLRAAMLVLITAVITWFASGAEGGIGVVTSVSVGALATLVWEMLSLLWRLLQAPIHQRDELRIRNALLAAKVESFERPPVALRMGPQAPLAEMKELHEAMRYVIDNPPVRGNRANDANWLLQASKMITTAANLQNDQRIPASISVRLGPLSGSAATAPLGIDLNRDGDLAEAWCEINRRQRGLADCIGLMQRLVDAADSRAARGPSISR